MRIPLSRLSQNCNLAGSFNQRLAFGGTAGGLHATTKGIVSALVAAGATVTDAQQDAIDVFIRAEIAAGRWGTKLKRLNVPVWGVEAANAVGWVSTTSGTFVGGVTHSAGTCTFNGTTGYYNSGRSFSEDGLTADDGYIFALATAFSGALGTTLIGAGATGNTTSLARALSGTQARLRYSGTTTGQVEGTVSAVTGILSASRNGGARTVWRRASGGRSQIVTAASAASGAPPASKVYAGCLNLSELPAGVVPASFAACSLAAWGWGLGFTDAEDAAFSANLATLYTALTGNALPA